MEDTSKLFKNRCIELSKRAFNRGLWTYTEFLTLAEQDMLARIRFDDLPAPYTLFGGYEGAERALACFGSDQLFGYTELPPIVCVKIAPLMQKFADKLTHRDYLGALMSLGIRRELLGDIVINENIGYLMCLESISEFIADSLNQVKHTSVKCTVLNQVPEFLITTPEPKEYVIPSERLDAIIASVYSLSRSESKDLFSQSKVYINSVQTVDAGKTLTENDIISVRGHGRFKYLGILRETKKGKLRVSVAVY